MVWLERKMSLGKVRVQTPFLLGAYQERSWRRRSHSPLSEETENSGCQRGEARQAFSLQWWRMQGCPSRQAFHDKPWYTWCYALVHLAGLWAPHFVLAAMQWAQANQNSRHPSARTSEVWGMFVLLQSYLLHLHWCSDRCGVLFAGNVESCISASALSRGLRHCS